MNARTIPVLLLSLALFASVPVLRAQEDTCLVIGEKLDPVKARRFLMEAMLDWRSGRSTRALDLYEQALLADRSVLTHDDEGMALALLKRMQDRAAVASPTTTMLCREGFFENIITGDLESAIQFYQRAAAATGATDLQATAAREADRLKAELAYVRNWQRQQQKRLADLRRRDEAAFARLDRVRSRENQIDDLEAEMEELDERLSYLRSRESESSARLYTTMTRRSRARRYYYYNDNPAHPTPHQTPPYPGPVLGPIPQPPPGAPGPLVSVDPGPLTHEFDPKPLQDTPPVQLPPPGTGIVTTLTNQPSPEQTMHEDTEVGSPEDLELYYMYRGNAREQKREIDQIRAEISGIERRKIQIEKEITRLTKEIDRESRPTPPPAASQPAGPWKPTILD